MKSTRDREGHGWWPYWVPMMSFLLLIEISNRLPDTLALPMLCLRIAVPLAAMFYFRSRGAYPELRFDRASPWLLADLLFGVALAGLWMGPFLLFPSLRPEPGGEFDPAMAGASLAPLVLSLRMVGYALVTPFMEELFMRSFVIRYAEVFNSRGDFRDVPIGHFTLPSFVAVVVIFTMTHVPWEWAVMVPWAVLTTLWLYFRKDILAVIVAHAGTNGAILLAAILAGEGIQDPAGSGLLPLWFFV